MFLFKAILLLVCLLSVCGYCLLGVWFVISCVCMDAGWSVCVCLWLFGLFPCCLVCLCLLVYFVCCLVCWCLCLRDLMFCVYLSVPVYVRVLLRFGCVCLFVVVVFVCLCLLLRMAVCCLA